MADLVRSSEPGSISVIEGSSAASEAHDDAPRAFWPSRPGCLLGRNAFGMGTEAPLHCLLLRWAMVATCCSRS